MFAAGLTPSRAVRYAPALADRVLADEAKRPAEARRSASVPCLAAACACRAADAPRAARRPGLARRGELGSPGPPGRRPAHQGAVADRGLRGRPGALRRSL